jgi:uncharacterized protein
MAEPAYSYGYWDRIWLFSRTGRVFIKQKISRDFYGYDTTVIKVFFTASIVALIGSQFLSFFGLLDLSMVYVNEFYVNASIVGGVIMGAGFIMGGFCPGTGLSALAMNSYKGPLKIDEILGLSPGIFTFLLIAVAVIMFWLAEKSEKIFARPDITNEQ